jgi:hypothetical protein
LEHAAGREIERDGHEKEKKGIKKGEYKKKRKRE